MTARPADNRAFRSTGPVKYPVAHPMKQPCVYIMSSGRNRTLYVGVSSNLVQRAWQHKAGLAEGFTKDHGVHTLVWHEAHDTMESAITREKRIKEWHRDWKCRLIERSNPCWRDLYEDLV